MAEGEPSYIDYEAFLDPEFSPAGFANTLVLSTNNATDTPLDLSTPLSRVLFDLQEIDTHIHALTTKSALPLLSHTQGQTEAAEHILQEAGSQIHSVTQGYERLEKEVVHKWKAADEARIAAENSLATVRLARAVARCLTLGRQLESQLADITGRGTGQTPTTGPGGAAAGQEGFRAVERAAYTILNLRQMLSAATEDDEGYGLERVRIMRTLRNEFVIPAENMVKARAQQTINRFSLTSPMAPSNGPSVPSSYKQARDARVRLGTAAATLYLLSPIPKGGVTVTDYKPELLLSTLQGYMHTAIMTSVNSLAKALSQLPTMDRTLGEVSARCQDIVALESILRNLRPPTHPLLESPSADPPTADLKITAGPNKTNLLQPLLLALDTSSLPSYYWRSLASALTSRVQDIVSRGGVSARTLRSNRDRLKAEIRECVMRASQVSVANLLAEKGRPGTDTVSAGWERVMRASQVSVANLLAEKGRPGTDTVSAGWEREAAVMVSSIVGPLGR
ncbi:Conserved oligomeric Golgi complex subunit 5 [Penicillium canariense]|uniref:Conserved oligomeric Golgi complex subunit 5 n=1 Tax=Penicillium canariense TaxID=189055 RepID=A0A9W9LS49_9EURO|nr:Conserved oligomeric Golgi complex subunit 5 [Penicillium canariense]KAJ5174693.1 Conserved oligomeric Golgi complex subunit 5 [Penicillium canariense]